MIAIPREPAKALEWLAENRLLPLVSLLRGRDLISSDLARLAEPLAKKRGVVDGRVLACEQRILKKFQEKNVPFLVLKGCLLAYLVYPKPNQRWRSDLDILIPPSQISVARRVLSDLDYAPHFQRAGGTPACQETWCSTDKAGSPNVDLHWGLRNHPIFCAVLSFEEQYQAAQELPDLGSGVSGQSYVHALMNSVMHWYDALIEQQRPLVWLLDNDLLWRAMSEPERRYVADLSEQRNIASLLADALALTRESFGTPVSDKFLDDLAANGRNEPASKLISLTNSRFRAFLFALQSEKGSRSRFRWLLRSLLPPAAHMRERYPDGSRFGLPGLYLRRLWRSVKQ